MADQGQGRAGMQIGRMHVRVPGDSHDAGHRVASHVQRALASMPLGGATHVPKLNLKVSIPRGAGPEVVAQAIAAELRRRLG